MGFRDSNLNRRDFLKVAGASAGALAVSQFLPPRVAEAAISAGLIDADGDGYIPTMCEMCVWRCGVLAKVKDGRVVKLEGNPDHPHSKGRLCARGQSGLMTTYDPDRILKPLVRVGPRGGACRAGAAAVGPVSAHVDVVGPGTQSAPGDGQVADRVGLVNDQGDAVVGDDDPHQVLFFVRQLARRRREFVSRILQ